MNKRDIFSKKLIVNCFSITDNSEPTQICNFTSTDLVLLGENYTSEGQVYLQFNSDSLYTAHGFRLKVSQGKYVVIIINL